MLRPATREAWGHRMAAPAARRRLEHSGSKPSPHAFLDLIMSGGACKTCQVMPGVCVCDEPGGKPKSKSSSRCRALNPEP